MDTGLRENYYTGQLLYSSVEKVLKDLFKLSILPILSYQA